MTKRNNKTIYIPVTALPLESVTGITDCVTGFPLASGMKFQINNVE